MTKSAISGWRPHRRAVLTGALSAGLIGAPMVARAQQKFVCRMGHSEAIGSPLTDAFAQWAKVLNEKSGGRIDAQHFPGEPARQLHAEHRAEPARHHPGHDRRSGHRRDHGARDRRDRRRAGFIYRDEAHVDRVLQGDIGREVSQIARQKTGVEFVDYGEVGFRHILSKRKVTNLDEVKGLKIRTPEIKLWIDFWKKVGANPTPLAYAEQYSALSTGLIDGLEADVFSIKGFKWGEQAKNLTLTAHWFLPKATRVNARWLDLLPRRSAEAGARQRQGGVRRTAQGQSRQYGEDAGRAEGRRHHGASAERHAEMAPGDRAAVRGVRREKPGHQTDDRQDFGARGFGVKSYSGEAKAEPHGR